MIEHNESLLLSTANCTQRECRNLRQSGRQVILINSQSIFNNYNVWLIIDCHYFVQSRGYSSSQITSECNLDQSTSYALNMKLCVILAPIFEYLSTMDFRWFLCTFLIQCNKVWYIANGNILCYLIGYSMYDHIWLK